MKGQEIVAAIAILLIAISTIAVAYVWSKPIIDKSSDKVRVDRCISYSKLIENSIENVINTGDSSNVRIQLPNSNIYFYKNKILITCNAKVQILPNFFVPLSYNELPIERENIRGNTTDVCGTNCKNGTIDIDGEIYEFNLTNTSTEYDRMCINSCGSVGDYIIAGNDSYQIAYIDPEGNYSYILGKYVEREGIFGLDPYGVVIGRQEGNVQIEIVFWNMIDKYGVIHRVHLISNRNATNGIINLHISKQSSNLTDTYINVEVI